MPSREEIQEAFRRAQRFWGILSLPEPIIEDGTRIAYFKLDARTVTFSPKWLKEHNVPNALAGCFVHEIGHHAKYPALAVSEIRNQLVLKQLRPSFAEKIWADIGRFFNVFEDTLINLTVAYQADRDLSGQLASIYAAMAPPASVANTSPDFIFYLMMLEIAFESKPFAFSQAAGRALIARVTDVYPGLNVQDDAQSLGQRLMDSNNIIDQMLMYSDTIAKYINLRQQKKQQQEKGPNDDDGSDGKDEDEDEDGDEDEDASGSNPFKNENETPPPTTEQVGEAINTSVDEVAARKHGYRQGDPVEGAGKILQSGGIPGQGAVTESEVHRIIAPIYKRLAAKYRINLPQTPKYSEEIPTDYRPWDISDEVKSIDWRASILHGSLARGEFEKRHYEREVEGSIAAPMDLEIYLDVSGSMPDPVKHVNYMTLAALVLSESAIEVDSYVRGVLYSDSTYKSKWMRTRDEAFDFFMNFIGGGTQFPFADFHTALPPPSGGQVVRVILSDDDFLHDAIRPGAKAELQRASRQSKVIVILQSTRSKQAEQVLAGLGVRLILVTELGDFPAIAAKIGRELF